VRGKWEEDRGSNEEQGQKRALAKKGEERSRRGDLEYCTCKTVSGTRRNSVKKEEKGRKIRSF